MLKRWPLLMGSGCANTPTTAPHSAFKSIATSCANALPPISSLRERESGSGGPIPTAAPHLPHFPSQENRARAILAQSAQLQQDMKVCGLPPTLGRPGLSGAGLGSPGLGLTSVSSTNHPTPHPAFPIPLTSFVQAPPPDGLNPLQHLMAGNKALALSHYLSDPLAKAALLDLGRYGHYPLGKKLFGCPQCRYVTDRKNNLKRHVATMHQECDKLLECCGVAFRNKASLRDHVLIFHSNGYMCRYCGRNFCRKALLKRHLTVHSGQKDYVCPLCDYATSHKSNLERHKKVHERQGSDQEDGGAEAHAQTAGYGFAHAPTHAHSRPASCDSSAAVGGLPCHQSSQQSTSGRPDRFSRRPLEGATHASQSVATVTSSSESPDDAGIDSTAADTTSTATTVTSTSTSTSTSPSMTGDGDGSHRARCDVQMTSISHVDVGGYSVDRILNTCQRRSDVTLGAVDVTDDDTDPRCLLDDDDDDDDVSDDVSDDDDDTHSSGVIDVVHIDLHD